MNETKIDIVTTEAIKVFFEMVTKMYPEVKNKEIPHTHKIELQNKAHKFIKRWVEINSNKYKIGDKFSNGYKIDEIYHEIDFKYKCVDQDGMFHFCTERMLDELEQIIWDTKK